MKKTIFLGIIFLSAVVQLQQGEVESEQTLKKEVVIRPSDISFNIRRKAFKDTVLNLDSEKNIKITIKVRNKEFLPMFAF